MEINKLSNEEQLLMKLLEQTTKNNFDNEFQESSFSTNINVGFEMDINQSNDPKWDMLSCYKLPVDFQKVHSKYVKSNL